MSDQKEEIVEDKQKLSIGDRFRRIVFAIFFFIVVLQIMGHNFPNLFPNKASEKPAGKIEKTETKPAIETSDTKTDKTEEGSSAIVVPTEDVLVSESPKDNERIIALEEKIKELEARSDAAIYELEKRLVTQNTAAQTKTETVVFKLIAFEQLKEAVKNGDAYSGELLKLKNLTSQDPDAQKSIDELKNNSETGIKTLGKLKTEFSPFIKQVLADKNENMFWQILHKFMTIRKVGQQKGQGDEEIIARAEVKLNQGDVTAALQELEQLPQPAQNILVSWKKDAQDFVSAHENINKLKLFLVQPEQASKL